MSGTNPSGESPEPGKCSERSAERGAAEPLAGSSNTEGGKRPAGRRLTEAELTIHDLHRRACQVNQAL